MSYLRNVMCGSKTCHWKWSIVTWVQPRLKSWRGQNTDSHPFPPPLLPHPVIFPFLFYTSYSVLLNPARRSGEAPQAPHSAQQKNGSQLQKLEGTRYTQSPGPHDLPNWEETRPIGWFHLCIMSNEAVWSYAYIKMWYGADVCPCHWLII